MMPVPRVSILRPRKSAWREMGDMLAVGIPYLLLNTWITMLLLGAAHREVSADIPALGYLQTLILLALVRAVLPAYGGLRARDLARAEGATP